MKRSWIVWLGVSIVILGCLVFAYLRCSASARLICLAVEDVTTSSGNIDVATLAAGLRRRGYSVATETDRLLFISGNGSATVRILADEDLQAMSITATDNPSQNAGGFEPFVPELRYVYGMIVGRIGEIDGVTTMRPPGGASEKAVWYARRNWRLRVGKSVGNDAFMIGVRVMANAQLVPDSHSP